MPFGGGGPGGGGGGGGAGPGGAVNPYMAASWSSSLLGGKKRMAPEVYWQVRTAASSCRAWMSLYYKGAKNDQRWEDVWGVSESVDLTLQQIYDSYLPEHHLAYQAVCHALLTDDRLENWLSRLAGEIAHQLTGEKALLDSMSTAKPPGATHLAPTWAVSDAMDTAKALALQRGRLRSGGTHGANDEGEATTATSRRSLRARRTGGSGGDGGTPAKSSPSGSQPKPLAGAGRGGKDS